MFIACRNLIVKIVVDAAIMASVLYCVAYVCLGDKLYQIIQGVI